MPGPTLWGFLWIWQIGSWGTESISSRETYSQRTMKSRMSNVLAYRSARNDLPLPPTRTLYIQVCVLAAALLCAEFSALALFVFDARTSSSSTVEAEVRIMVFIAALPLVAGFARLGKASAQHKCHTKLSLMTLVVFWFSVLFNLMLIAIPIFMRGSVPARTGGLGGPM